ncbi:hypothetical protein [Alcaligenes sp. WGS1538]|uniref:hypothetical protein n=1 Tax=Alcaligenes sp. WGS1538 TaxID=3366811 RepID=UPI00372D7CCA
MIIRPLGQASVQNLQRHGLKPISAGMAGGLRFSAEPGVEPRGGNVSVTRPDSDAGATRPDGNASATRPDSDAGAWPCMGSLLNGLKFFVSRIFPELRSRPDAVTQAHSTSLLVRALVGSLAALAEAPQGSRKAVKELARLSELSQGDLISLPEGWKSLSSSLDELQRASLLALRTKVLGREAALAAVLKQVSPDISDQAAGVLKQIRKALDERFVNVFIQEPLEELCTLISLSSIEQLEDNQVKIAELLNILYTGLYELGLNEEGKRMPREDVLSAYFRALPESTAQSMLSGLWYAKLLKIHMMMFGRPLPSSSEIGELLAYNNSSSMAGCLGMWAEKEAFVQAQPALRQVGKKLMQAEAAQDRRAGSKVLSDLDLLVNKTEEIAGGLTNEFIEDVRSLIKTGLNLLRDAKTNPAGPLNEHSLQRLDDASLGHLRQALRLHPLGLELDLAAADEIARQRVEGHGRRAVQGMMDVLRTLAGEKVHMPALLRQLRDLSGLELQRLLHLVELGQFASGLKESDCLALARETCAQAVDQLSRTRQTVVVRNVMRHMSLLKSLEVAFGKIVSSTKPALAQKAYKDGGMEIGLQLDATYRLLSVMVETLYGLLPEMIERDDSEATIELCEQMLALLGTLSDFEVLSGSFYSALQGQYGVAYDPAADRAAVVVTDAARATLAPELERGVLASAGSNRKIVLPINGQPREFVVSRWFHEDGIEHGAISLSVRGGAADGRAVRFMWPDPASPDARLQAMGAALQALDRLAGVHIESLTGLMNYKYMAGAVIKGLWGMGVHAPFTLADGLAIHPDGKAELDFDVKQNADDSLDMEATVTFSSIRKARGVRPDGTLVFVTLNPDAASWAQARFTVNVSPDGGQIKVVGLPQFRHHFELESIHE